jgi:hypothetical protein
MELCIDTELQRGLLLVTLRGDAVLDAALRLFKQMFDTAKEKGVSKILVNALAVNGELSTLERYRLGVELVEYLQQHQMNPRLAAVGKPPAADAFAARVGQNRGVSVEMFSSQQKALSWLDKWPN